VLNTTDDAALAVFVESSLIARGWLDPAPRETDRVFQDMVESVVSGQNEPAGAVFDASQELQTLVK
jgi:hypothetical protein